MEGLLILLALLGRTSSTSIRALLMMLVWSWRSSKMTKESMILALAEEEPVCVHYAGRLLS